jgi:hypothetical protein
VPAEDLPRIYQEANLGINIDEINYETFFGARNRLNNLMAAGVPVLTTYGSEISQMIDEGECGVVCPPGNVEALVRGVVRMLREPDERRRLGERARQFARGAFSPEALTEGVRAWARRPQLAPDNAEKLRGAPHLLSFLETSCNYLEETAKIAQDHDLLALRQAYEDLTALRAKWWYRLLRALKRRLRFSASAPLPDPLPAPPDGKLAE